MMMGAVCTTAADPPKNMENESKAHTTTHTHTRAHEQRRW